MMNYIGEKVLEFIFLAWLVVIFVNMLFGINLVDCARNLVNKVFSSKSWRKNDE